MGKEIHHEVSKEAQYALNKKKEWENFRKWEEEHPEEAADWKEKCQKEGWPYHPYR